MARGGFAIETKLTPGELRAAAPHWGEGLQGSSTTRWLARWKGGRLAGWERKYPPRNSDLTARM